MDRSLGEHRCVRDPCWRRRLWSAPCVGSSAAHRLHHGPPVNPAPVVQC